MARAQLRWNTGTALVRPNTDAVVSAPTAPFTVGTQVGVPTGTSLTSTSGLPAADATESWTLTNRITGLQAVIVDQPVWRRRSWTATLQLNPGPGQTYIFDQCRFVVPEEFFVVDTFDDDAAIPFSQSTPLFVFQDCEFDGQGSSSRCLNADFAWVIRCDMRGAEDAWGAGIFSYGEENNLVAATDQQADPHPDGFQISSHGRSHLYRCWVNAGTDPGANSAFRVGTENGAAQDIKLYYCTLGGGGYPLQINGGFSGGAGVSGIDVQHCRWTGLQGFGPTDFADTTDVTWVDNRYLDSAPGGLAGAVVPQP